MTGLSFGWQDNVLGVTWMTGICSVCDFHDRPMFWVDLLTGLCPVGELGEKPMFRV